jgi:hypothetical protein
MQLFHKVQQQKVNIANDDLVLRHVVQNLT